MKAIHKYLLKQGFLGFAVIAFVFGLGYLFLFRPFVAHLREQTYENYRLVAMQKEMNTEQFISRSMEGANSLSSRTMIRNAIGDYLEGAITFDELVSYTQPRYADGVNALAHVDASTRVVDGDVIAKVPTSADAVTADDVQDVTATEYEIISQEENTWLIVVSPIVLDGDVIGHDIVRFMMCDFLDELNEENGEACTIISLDERHSLLNGVDMLIAEDEYRVFKKDKDIIYFSDGLSDSNRFFMRVSTRIDIVESDLREITTRILIWDGILFVASFAAVFYLISRETSSRIKVADYQRLLYQEKANKDALTGIYSRHYLADWLQRVGAEDTEAQISLTVVMCDINGFKQYNDTYGHEAGDRVLIDVGKILMRHTNENEVVIRYGGDEFLLVSKDFNQKQCEEVMKRINRDLEQENGITLAYGIAVAKNPNELESAIDQADKRMYKAKIKFRS